MLRRLAVLLLCGWASAAVAQEFDPNRLDLPALIECRSTVQAFNALGFWLTTGADAANELGWTALPSVNPFLQEYGLTAPVEVFGHGTKTIAFAATGPMVVLDDVDPHALARELGVTPMVDNGEKFLGEKVIVEESEEDAGTIYITRIALNVSTVDTHPGKTLAGCSYSIETKDAG